MARLNWDQEGEKRYEAGVDRGVVYPMGDKGYSNGEAWNGLISVDEKPSGAEPTPLHANNRKYLELLSDEEFAGAIGAYTYPDGFNPCLGIKELAPGVYVTQQARVPFGLTYRNIVGNDTKKDAFGYKIHLVYGAMAKPTEKSNKTMGDTPEAAEMSWEFSTTPVDIPNCKPSAHIVIDSTTLEPAKLKALEDILYGSESEEPRLPLPTELATIIGGAA